MIILILTYLIYNKEVWYLLTIGKYYVTSLFYSIWKNFLHFLRENPSVFPFVLRESRLFCETFIVGVLVNLELLNVLQLLFRINLENSSCRIHIKTYLLCPSHVITKLELERVCTTIKYL